MGDNERLCAIEFRLRLKRSPPEARPERGAARSVSQSSTYWMYLFDSIQNQIEKQLLNDSYHDTKITSLKDKVILTLRNDCSPGP